MLQQAQQFALWRAVEAKSVIAGFEALKGLDPLARALLRRRLWRIVKRADFATTLSEPRHRYLLAYLLGAGVNPPEPDDVAAVEPVTGRVVLPSPVLRPVVPTGFCRRGSLAATLLPRRFVPLLGLPASPKPVCPGRCVPCGPDDSGVGGLVVSPPPPPLSRG